MNQTLKKVALGAICMVSASTLLAQEPIKKQAFKGVIIHHADGKIEKSASIVWNEKFFSAIGSSSTDGALTVDGGDTLHVYPAFIDGLGTHGSPSAASAEKVDDPGNPSLSRAGIEPHRKPHLMWDAKKAKEFEAALAAGFGAANLALEGYMLPGSTDLAVMTNGTPLVIAPEIGQAAGFVNAPGGWRNGVYPSTLMGLMARYRQLWYDATALKAHIAGYEAGTIAEPPVRSQEHEAMFPYLDGSKKLFFVADESEDIERLFKLQDELGFSFVLVSGKEAYKKAEMLKARNIDVLASFSFDIKKEEKKKGKKDAVSDSTATDDVEDKEDEVEAVVEKKVDEAVVAFDKKAADARAAQLMNIRKLMDAGVNVGYASLGEKKGDFKKGVEAMLKAGYTEAELVKLLSHSTAKILMAADQLGQIKSGQMANFFVTDKEMSDKKAKILYTVSGGVLKDHRND
jgi:hypothetical protein